MCFANVSLFLSLSKNQKLAVKVIANRICFILILCVCGYNRVYVLFLCKIISQNKVLKNSQERSVKYVSQKDNIHKNTE